MIKNGDNVVLKFSTMWDGELCRDKGKAYIYPSMDRAKQFYHPGYEVLVEYAPVKHGHWILQKDGYHCSNCDIQAIYTGVELKYCPNCGAIMDGGNENG